MSLFNPSWLRTLHLTSLLLFLLVAGCSMSEETKGKLHQDISIKLDPTQASINITNIVEFPENTSQVDFILHSAFSLSVSGAELKIKDKNSERNLVYYQLSRLDPGRKVQLKYHGSFMDSYTQSPPGRSMPRTVFSDEFIYLDGNSAWYPRFAGYSFYTFDMDVSAPDNWQVISQGAREIVNGKTLYSEPNPQDDIYLIAGTYQRYISELLIENEPVELEVYLLDANPSLAKQYLQRTAGYLKDYSDLIGSYPYKKFAIIENPYQTGYGMPGFTLLGSRVIRLPFILTTSLPHEILHNWWGNGVFVNFNQGNWSEGLTAYMADHAASEMKNGDAEYRRKALERYANFAAKQRDFPLQEFTSRHNESSQAVGYSKSLMLFHMLRNQLGDDMFYANLKTFWHNHQFTQASFNDLINTLLSGSEINPSLFQKQWLSRAGAPELSLGKVDLTELPSGYRLQLELKQSQSEPVYHISVPIVIETANKDKIKKTVYMDKKTQTFEFSVDDIPVMLKIDPEFDIFRLLSKDERPASLGNLFGASKQYLVYPSSASADSLRAWQNLANAWHQLFNNIEFISDEEWANVPKDIPMWILGWENQAFDWLNETLTDKKLLSSQDNALVFVSKESREAPVGFIGSSSVQSTQQLARKLPHYKSYGHLVFDAQTGANLEKRALPVNNSPLNRKLD